MGFIFIKFILFLSIFKLISSYSIIINYNSNETYNNFECGSSLKNYDYKEYPPCKSISDAGNRIRQITDIVSNSYYNDLYIYIIRSETSFDEEELEIKDSEYFGLVQYFSSITISYVDSKLKLVENSQLKINGGGIAKFIEFPFSTDSIYYPVADTYSSLYSMDFKIKGINFTNFTNLFTISNTFKISIEMNSCSFNEIDNIFTPSTICPNIILDIEFNSCHFSGTQGRTLNINQVQNEVVISNSTIKFTNTYLSFNNIYNIKFSETQIFIYNGLNDNGDGGGGSMLRFFNTTYINFSGVFFTDSVSLSTQTTIERNNLNGNEIKSTDDINGISQNNQLTINDLGKLIYIGTYQYSYDTTYLTISNSLFNLFSLPSISESLIHLQSFTGNSFNIKISDSQFQGSSSTKQSVSEFLLIERVNSSRLVYATINFNKASLYIMNNKYVIRGYSALDATISNSHFGSTLLYYNDTNKETAYSPKPIYDYDNNNYNNYYNNNNNNNNNNRKKTLITAIIVPVVAFLVSSAIIITVLHKKNKLNLNSLKFTLPRLNIFNTTNNHPFGVNVVNENNDFNNYQVRDNITNYNNYNKLAEDNYPSDV